MKKLARFWNLALHFPACKREYLRENFFNISVLVMSCPYSPNKPRSSIRKKIYFDIINNELYCPALSTIWPCLSTLQPRALCLLIKDNKRVCFICTLESKLVAFGPHEKMDTKRKWLNNKWFALSYFQNSDIKRHWGRAMLGKIKIFPDLSIFLFKKIYNTHESQMSYLIVHNYTDV